MKKRKEFQIKWNRFVLFVIFAHCTHWIFVVKFSIQIRKKFKNFDLPLHYSRMNCIWRIQATPDGTFYQLLKMFIFEFYRWNCSVFIRNIFENTLNSASSRSKSKQCCIWLRYMTQMIWELNVPLLLSDEHISLVHTQAIRKKKEKVCILWSVTVQKMASLQSLVYAACVLYYL